MQITVTIRATVSAPPVLRLVQSRRAYPNHWQEHWMGWAPWCGHYHVEPEPIVVRIVPPSHAAALRAWAGR